MDKKEDKTIKRALISGGGTGGHIFPALSIAKALERRYPGIEILFVGADNRMEMERVPAAGYRIVGLPVSGFDRKNMLRNIKVLLRLWRSLRMARKVVKDFRPDIAVGVGGFASGPTLKAAQKAGVPTFLQEQNSYAGVTNKLLGKKARAICVAYDNMDRFFPAESIHLTGNPVRPALLDCHLTREQAKKQMGFDPAKPLVLVVGGSLGARTINRSMSAGLDAFSQADVQLYWQTGKYDTESFLEQAKSYPNVKATVFISDMAMAYRAADLVVSRAGAGTISELQLLGKPCILVPSPNVSEDHQTHNAMALAKRDAAVMVKDSEAPDNLVKMAIELVKRPDRLEKLSKNASAMALRDADDKIVDIIADNL